MKTKLPRDSFGAIAIIALSIMFIMIAAAAVAASCLFADYCERVGRSREDAAEQVVVTFDCPLTVRAIDTCLGQTWQMANMPVVGSGVCIDDLDEVFGLLDECSTGAIKDSEAADMIESIGLDAPPADLAIWI